MEASTVSHTTCFSCLPHLYSGSRRVRSHRCIVLQDCTRVVVCNLQAARLKVPPGPPWSEASASLLQTIVSCLGRRICAWRHTAIFNNPLFQSHQVHGSLQPPIAVLANVLFPSLVQVRDSNSALMHCTYRRLNYQCPVNVSLGVCVHLPALLVVKPIHTVWHSQRRRQSPIAVRLFPCLM
jgi:hypothetical protein